MEEFYSTLSFALPRSSRLRSTTVRTLVRIFSHCVDDSSPSASQIALRAQNPGNKDPNCFTGSAYFPGNELLRLQNDEKLQNPVANGNSKSTDVQNRSFGDEGVVLRESGQREGRDEFVGFENFLPVKDTIREGNQKAIDAQKVIFVGRECGQREERDKLFDEFETSVVEKDPVAGRDPKSIDAESRIFGHEDPVVCTESKERESHNQCIEFHNSIVDKNPIAEGGPKEIETRKETFVDGISVIRGESGQQELCGEIVEYENPTMENGPTAEGNCKLIDAQKEIFVGEDVILGRESGQLGLHDEFIEFENPIMEMDPIVVGNPEPIDTKEEISVDEGAILGGEPGQQERHDDFMEFKILSVEKDSITKGNPKSNDAEKDIFVDADTVVGLESAKQEGPDEFVEFDLPNAKKSTIDEGNSKLFGVQKEILVDEDTVIGRESGQLEEPRESIQIENLSVEEDFGGGGSSVDLESGKIMQHVGSNESVDCKIEIENLSKEENMNMDINHKPTQTQDGLICDGGSLVDNELGQIGPDGRGKSADCGNLELKNLIKEKGPITDGTPKLINSKDEYFCDGRSPVPMELRQQMQLHGSDELIKCNDLQFWERSLEKYQLTEESPKAVKLGQGAQQHEHNGFIDHNCLAVSTSFSEKTPIEDICISFDSEEDDGSELIVVEKLEQQMQPGDHLFKHVNPLLQTDSMSENLKLAQTLSTEQSSGETSVHEVLQQGLEPKTLDSSDDVAKSSSLRDTDEGININSINDPSDFIDEEMEEGEIPGDSEVPLETHSQNEHISFAERQEKEVQIPDDLTKEGGNFAQTHGEHLTADKNDTLFGFDFTGSFVFSEKLENCVGRQLMVKGTNGIENDFEKTDSKKNRGSSSNKKNRGKHASINENIQTPNMEARNDRLKGVSACRLDTSDSLEMPGDFSEEMRNQNQGETSTVKGAKVRKKRQTLTEARKATKKLAKKRKRAEQNRKLGVKRLKLQPILKPKVVSDCKFYLKGKCQQGDKCKFSHAAIPLTKSQPCKYFGYNSCLKGDDCPFDHDLSKYPCNSYMSKGFCSKGDTCQFSHQVPINDSGSGDSKVHDPESLFSPCKTNSKQQLNIIGTPTVALNHVLKDTPVRTPSTSQKVLYKHPKQHVAEVRPKLLTQAPEGVRFLSFGEDSLDDTIKKQEDNLRSKYNSANMNEMKCRSPGSSLSTPLAFGPKNMPPLSRNVHLAAPSFAENGKSDILKSRSAQAPLNVDADNVLENRSFIRGPPTQPHKKCQSRLTDASNILEEFLFSWNEQ